MCIDPLPSLISPSSCMALTALETFSLLSQISSARSSMRIFMCFSPAGLWHLCSMKWIMRSRTDSGVECQIACDCFCAMVEMMFSRFMRNMMKLSDSFITSCLSSAMKLHCPTAKYVVVYRCFNPNRRSGCKTVGAFISSVMLYRRLTDWLSILSLPFIRNTNLSQVSPSRITHSPSAALWNPNLICATISDRSLRLNP